MSDRTMHRIDIEHNWSDSESMISRTSKGSFTSIRTCKDCDAQRAVLHLDATRSEHTSVDVPKYPRNALIDSLRQLAKALEDDEQRVFANSNYPSFIGFAAHLDSFYEKSVNIEDIDSQLAKNFVELEHKPTPKKQRNKLFRKLLLTWKQGPVCNRCDNIFAKSNLTEDHILPRASGGESKLPNLQLLCDPCNKQKGDKEPGPDDVSPFEREGETCNHFITCRELTQMRVKQ